MANILIISPGHGPDRISRQPWAYLQGIADQLARREHNVVVVGDGPLGDGIIEGSIQFEEVDSVRDVDVVVDIARSVKADVCLWSVGPTSTIFLARRLTNIADTMIAVVPGPLYLPGDLLTQLSLRDLIDFPSYASLAASSVVPQAGFARFLRNNFDCAVAPTRTIVEVIISGGFNRDKTLHIPHGSDCGILTTATNAESFRDEIPTPPNGRYVVNFGPPRPIRGATDFVEGVLTARANGSDLTGVMLARLDDEDDRERFDDILADLASRGERDAFVVTETYLTPYELKTFLRGASAVVLPYRIVQSTVPISILEGLGLERPVITTDVNGARELVPDPKWTVPPNASRRISDAIESVDDDAVDGSLSEHLPTWSDSVQPLANQIKTEIAEP